MENEELKRIDQISMLEESRDFTDTGEWKGGFSYPGCGYDLVKQGLANKDKTITDAGRAALFLLGKGDDQTESKAVETFEVNLNSQQK